MVLLCTRVFIFCSIFHSNGRYTQLESALQQQNAFVRNAVPEDFKTKQKYCVISLNPFYDWLLRVLYWDKLFRTQINVIESSQSLVLMKIIQNISFVSSIGKMKQHSLPATVILYD